MAHHKIGGHTGLFSWMTKQRLIWIDGDVDDHGHTVGTPLSTLQKDGLPFKGANPVKAKSALERHVRTTGCAGC